MLTGQFDLSHAKETVALPSTTDVASFTDTNLSDTASSFTATIDWGDGTTTPGTVVGSNGSFTVEGGHTYADENQFPALVTVTRTADSSQLLIAGTVPVADTDVFSNLHGNTITFTPNTPLTNVTVATFSDSNTVNGAGDFTAQIDWGDGTTTTGTVQGSNGSFSIVGSHTYTASGEFAVSVAFADDAPDAATGSVQSTAVSGFGGTVTLTSATEGTQLTGVEVATFADTSASHAATDYTATIDWGDGSSSAGTISGSGQSFSVTGTHTYADEEANESLVNGEPAPSPVMKVTVTRTADSATIAPSGTVTVADADVLTMTNKTVGSSANQALTNVTVATFTDAYTGNTASDLAATIDWGDGSTTDVGTISGATGSFTVTGSHTYTADGQYNVNVAILDDIPLTGQIGAVISTAIIGLAAGTATNPNVPEGAPIGGPIATFNDGDTSDTAAAFSASIDWGDGTTTTGTITGSNGSFTVTSSPHAYADEGDNTITTTVTRTADHETATMIGTATITEIDNLAITPLNFSANPGQSFTGNLASFTTSYTGNVAGDFSATIDWGDGTTTGGTVSGGSGNFLVSGSHTYTAGGNDTFRVTVFDDAPGTASISGTGTATINFAGQMVLHSATEGTAIANGTPVATFSDSNGGDTPSDFTATITWGDGTTSSGTVSGGAGTFTVSGGHTYADEGNDTAKVVLTHTVDHATSTVSGSVAVAEADVLTAHPTSFTVNAHQTFTGTVATFGDSGFPANLAGDFLATIDWGDGTVTGGTVSGGSGTFTVSGSHAYAAAGHDNITVTLTDDAPGTASATAVSTATVNQGISLPFDFNGDTISDLVFQNEAGSAGTPQIWLWNGTAVTSQMVYPNPGASWHIVTSRDVNGDGKADLIWQNSDGTPGIWLMNGTTPIAQAGLTNPGSSWHLVASGDTNGDAKSDLIWQNSDGTLGVWLMNGTTPIAEAGIGNPGANWKVVGTADFNADNHDDILLQDSTTGNLMIDLMNGTSISSSKTIAVGDPSWHAISTGEFNGQAEIAWQNNNGTPGIWLMNGTTPVAQAGLQNPGAGWQLISVDHFTPNGHADLLFQNTNGAMGLWELNGTTIVAESNLPNPGAGWQSENGHPFTPASAFGPVLGANSDQGSGALHLSAPDSGVGGAPGSPSNLQHMTFARG
jgi:VCBS repeat protein